MNIYIGQFSKDKNSTKQPVLSSMRQESVELKKDTSVMFPVFRLQKEVYAIDYNYIYVPKWHRYYYIDNAIAVMGGIWELACTEDCLASWKTQIGADTYYILRSSAAYNTDIADDYYPAFQNCQTETTFGTNLFSIDLDSGYYVIGIVSRASYTDANGMGAVAYYVMDSAQMRELLETLMASSSWLGVPTEIADGGVSSGLLKALYNPFQYIVSCKWFPFRPPTGAGIGGGLPYGWWTLSMDTPAGHTVNAWKLGSTPVYEIDSHIDIMQHPQAAERGFYLNGSPFRKLEFCAGPFGVIPIDANAINNVTRLGFTVRCDCITGEATLLMSVGTPTGGDGANYDHLLPMHHANMGVDIQLAQLAVDRLSQAETVISGAAAVTRDTSMTIGKGLSIKNIINPAAGIAETVAAGATATATATHAIADGIRASVPSLQISGSQGSVAGYDGTPMMLHTFYRIVDEDMANIGRPYCAEGSPAQLGNGFYMMKRGEFNSAANSVENNIIGGYLTDGFKYE